MCEMKSEQSQVTSAHRNVGAKVQGQKYKFSVSSTPQLCTLGLHRAACLEKGVPFPNPHKDVLSAAGFLEGRCALALCNSVTWPKATIGAESTFGFWFPLNWRCIHS